MLILGILDQVAAPAGDFESIATNRVTSAQSSVTFSSIPQTFQHLQIRYMSLNTSATDYIMRFNGDSANNYRAHNLYGDGASAISSLFGSQASVGVGFNNQTTQPISGVIDILDYAITNKNKTTRTLYGWEANGTGQIVFTSGAYFLTPAITSITISVLTGNINTNSIFALYGIRG